jgi:hypothetical protein
VWLSTCTEGQKLKQLKLLLNIDFVGTLWRQDCKWSSHWCCASGLFLYGSSLCFYYQQPSTFSLKLRACTVTLVSTVMKHVASSACNSIFLQLYYKEYCFITRLNTASLVILQQWGHYSGQSSTKQYSLLALHCSTAPSLDWSLCSSEDTPLASPALNNTLC